MILIQAVVLDIDKDNERFSLGIKQIQPDPWKLLLNAMKSVKKFPVQLQILLILAFLLNLEEGIEGLVHVSEISKEKIKTPVGNLMLAMFLLQK